MEQNPLLKSIYGAISKLRITHFIASFEVGDKSLILPEYKGSMFRGALGHAFQEITCTCSFLQNDQHEKIHLDDCIYAYIFETKISKDSRIMRGNDEVPRPFVILPPLDNKKEYLPGDRFYLSFTLFGDANDYLIDFINVLDRMGENGLGKGRRKALLKQVFFEDIYGDLHPIFNSRQREINLRDDMYNSFEVDQLFKQVHTSLEVHFITPTRLKYQGQFINAPEFNVLLRAIMRRLTALLYFHHGGYKLEIDFKHILDLGEAIKLSKNNISWYDWQRYSNRQNERMKMGGIIGHAIYEGDFSILYPLVKLGEWIHIGKNPVFGLGKIKVVSRN